MNKKGEIEPMQLIVLFIILVIVAAIVIYYFTTQFNKEKSITEGQIGNLGDSDGDNVPNFLDKCPGTAAGASVDSNGCSADQIKSGAK